jgi:hypothetical protein
MDWSLRSTVTFIDVGADVDHRDVRVLPPFGSACTTEAKRVLLGERFDVHDQRLEPAESATATRSSTFSLRVAAISTSCSSGLSATGPRTWKSRFTSSSANGMYWFASLSTCTSSSSLAQARRHHDLLRDHRAGRHGHRDVLRARAERLCARRTASVTPRGC